MTAPSRPAPLGRQRVAVAVVGAGWAGCAAAVEANRRGHDVTLFEATRTAGGRARRLAVESAGSAVTLDNGQHILIGAYTDTLQLMADVGVDVPRALLRLPLTLQYPGETNLHRLQGLRLPQLPAPLDGLIGILRVRGWSWADKASLLAAAVRWRLAGFRCAPLLSVADLCRQLTPRVVSQLIEPLCVSALNTPAARASGEVFLRVVRDALFAPGGGSNLLLPKVDLSALMPDAAIDWLRRHGSTVRLGTRVQTLQRSAGALWQLTSSGHVQDFDQIILACPPSEAARLVPLDTVAGDGWCQLVKALTFEAITTVYVHAAGCRLPLPMLALASDPESPAQFVFDRGQLGGEPGLLAFVVSASHGDNDALTHAVVAQAIRQLELKQVTHLQTVVEKRATFACTPGLVRPPAQVLPGLWACGDYVEGPYPATLEGAVRSGLAAARALH